MFTPQEILEQRESLGKSMFGGYNVSAVDELLEPLQEDYAALYKENAVLKSKMKVLVEKLEEYRDREENIKKTLLKAQAAADEMVASAERQSARMLSDSEQRLRQRSQELSAEVLAEQERADMAKETAARFIVELEERFNEQLLQLEKIKEMDLTTQSAQAPAEPPAQSGERRAATRPPVTINGQQRTPQPETEQSGDPSQEAGGNIARIIEESEPELGDTRVIGPIES